MLCTTVNAILDIVRDVSLAAVVTITANTASKWQRVVNALTLQLEIDFVSEAVAIVAALMVVKSSSDMFHTPVYPLKQFMVEFSIFA